MSKGDETNSRVFIEETLIGIFGVTESNEIIEKTLYPSDPKQIAAAIDRLSTGDVTREVVKTLEKLTQRGFDTFVFSNSDLAENVRERFGLQTEVETRTKAGDYLRGNLEKLAAEYGLVEDIPQFYALNREVSLLKAREAIRRAQTKREVVITQAVQLLNELDKTLNVLSSKLREWHGLHFPELSRHIENHKTYALIVDKFVDRANLEVEILQEIGLDKGRSKAIVSSAQNSMGAPLMPGDLEQIRQLASHLLSLYGYRQGLEVHIASTAREVAPNLSEVAGPVLASKLIEKAGGLRKLAMMPSSTIQLLGAEKAFFRAKKSGTRLPKHGLIFQHPYVHSKPRKLRGRAARALSGKLAIAARADAFSGNLLGVQLKRELSDMEGAWRDPSSK